MRVFSIIKDMSFAFDRLTAWVTRLFQEAKFQDWENFLYIEPEIISKAMAWLVDHHDNRTGAFFETDNYTIPLDPKMDPKVRPAFKLDL